MANPLENNEIVQSFGGSIKNRLSTPLYGVYILAWAAFHWEFLYTAFLVSEEKVWQKAGQLKNEYLMEHYFDPSEWRFYASWLIPAIITYLVIWILPGLIGIRAFEKEQRDKTRKRVFLLGQEETLSRAKADTLQAEASELQAVGEKVKQEKVIEDLDPVTVWAQEYEGFKKSALFEHFGDILESIYKFKGWTQYGNRFSMNRDVLIYADSNGLIEIVENGTEVGDLKVKLTDKGKYFVKRYNLDDNQPIDLSKIPF